MATTPLSDLPLPNHHPLLAARAAAVGWGTAGEVLLTPPLALAERLDLDAAAVDGLLLAAAAAVVGGMAKQTVRVREERERAGGRAQHGPHSPSFLSIPRPHHTQLLDALIASRSAPPPIPTGLPALDAILRGGLPRGLLTELVGPAGVGKTQLCLGAVAAALAADPAACAVYLDAEGAFSAARLAGVLAAKGACAGLGDGGTAAVEAALTERVAVVAPSGPADAAARLRALAAARPSGLALLVLDSVPALVSTSAGDDVAAAPTDLIARAAAVSEVAAAAKALAGAVGCAVLAVNQVTAPRSRGGGGGGTGDAVVAALGPGWAHAASTRLVVEARPWPGGTGVGVGVGGGPAVTAATAAGGLRWVWVAKSPAAPAGAAPFIIGPGGPAPPPGDVAAAALAAAGGGPPPRPPWASSGEAAGCGGGVLGAALWGDAGLPEEEEAGDWT